MEWPEDDHPAAAGLTSTPSLRQLALVAALSGWKFGDEVTVVDPTCGTAGMLKDVATALHDSGHQVSAKGADINPEAIEQARGELTGLPVTSQLRVLDTLTQATGWESSAELVINDPPYELLGAASPQTLRSTGWYVQGLGDRDDATWLFVQRAVSLLRSPSDGGGRAIVFCARRALIGGGRGSSVRSRVVESDLIEAVVRLPTGLASMTQMPLYMLVLNNAKQGRARGRINLIDLTGFFTARPHGNQRAIRQEGLTTLSRALGEGKSGPSNRILEFEQFSTVKFTASRGDWVHAPQWIVDGSWAHPAQQRYGPVPVHLRSRGATSYRLELNLAAGSGKAKNSAPDWPTTRLSALLLSPPTASAEQPDDLPESGGTLRLPSGQGDASALAPKPGVEQRGRVLQFIIDGKWATAQFLADWLNSQQGRQAKAAALDQASTGSAIRAVRSDVPSLWRLADELVVPVPPLDEQRRLVNFGSTLRSMESSVSEARDELWTHPDRGALILAPYEPLIDQSLEGWTQYLPYPVASAVWTYMSRGSTEARHRQVLHTWDSYAAFLATVLLSIVKQDDGLSASEEEVIRRVLRENKLSLTHASIGSWLVVVERLTSTFRTMANSTDTDEQARARTLFGGADLATIRVILSTSTVRLLRNANQLRNEWSGHSGAESETALAAQVEELEAILKDLKGEVGAAWSKLPLVRAGTARRRDGKILQAVEMVMGTAVPFRHQTLHVGDLMTDGELYLATDGCVAPVLLSHLIVLRAGPADARFACYFYNRTDGKNVRMVSYQLPSSGDINEPLDSLELNMEWLLEP